MNSSHAFPPSRRLHYRREYRSFFNKSEVFRLPECVILRIPNALGHYRLGITIKARARSIDRNRVKRTLRELFRTHPDGLGSFDYNVVIPNHKKILFPYPKILNHCLKERFFNAKSTSSPTRPNQPA